MIYQKVTMGYVTQQFDETGKCVFQSFIAGDEMFYETMDESTGVTRHIESSQMPTGNDVHYPFIMMQPKL